MYIHMHVFSLCLECECLNNDGGWGEPWHSPFSFCQSHAFGQERAHLGVRGCCLLLQGIQCLLYMATCTGVEREALQAVHIHLLS